MPTAPRGDDALWLVRFPRVLLAVLVGAALGCAGALMQGVFGNPLAEPGVIGVSSGAAIGAFSVIVFGIAALGSWTVPTAAFMGALLATLIVYGLARSGGRTEVVTLVLVGIAVTAFAGALIGMLTFVSSDDALRAIAFWNLGSLARATWDAVFAVTPFVIVGVSVALYYAPQLDLLALGERPARHLGVDVERLRLVLIVVIAMLAGAGRRVHGHHRLRGSRGAAPHPARHRARRIGSSSPRASWAGRSSSSSATSSRGRSSRTRSCRWGCSRRSSGRPFFFWLIRRTRAQRWGLGLMVDRLASRWRELGHVDLPAATGGGQGGRRGPGPDGRAGRPGGAVGRRPRHPPWRAAGAGGTQRRGQVDPAGGRRRRRRGHDREHPHRWPAARRLGHTGSWRCAGRCCSSASTSRSRSRSATWCAWVAHRGRARTPRTMTTGWWPRPWSRPTSATSRAREYPSLSGGERARAALARVLAQGTGILLLDEPTAALDIHHQELVMGVARERADAGVAVVVVAHDLGMAAAWADRVVVLDRGPRRRRRVAARHPDRGAAEPGLPPRGGGHAASANGPAAHRPASLRQANGARARWSGGAQPEHGRIWSVPIGPVALDLAS